LKADLLGSTVDQTKKNRILILDAAGVVKYVVHRSTVDKFITEQAFSGKPVADLNLENLLLEPEYEAMISSFGTVGREARLNTVKAVVDGNPKCIDVVVTEDGSKNTRAIGWITNIMVAEKSRA
jgi:hypothetical protein